MPEPAVMVSHLRVLRGGSVVIPDLSLEVERGSVTGLLGPSGSGKTTLMRSIVGVQVVAGGDVRVLGLPAGSRALRSRVGYVTQAPSVYRDLTVRENLAYFARILGCGAGAAASAIETVALGGFEERGVGSLSGGEQARVSLATALLNSPAVLVLDEPTVGLDPVLRRDLWATFRRLAATGITLLVSSHVMDEADRCDQLVLIRDGRALATGSPAELRTRTDARTIEDAFLALIEREVPA